METRYQTATVDGKEYLLIPEDEARKTGMFGVSTNLYNPVIDARSNIPGPYSWSVIGFVDISKVSPNNGGSQDGYPETWVVMDPGDINFSITLKPTGIVFWAGLRVDAYLSGATRDGQTGVLTWDPTQLGAGNSWPVSLSVVKASNVDVITGDSDQGADASLFTQISPNYLLIHGISNNNPLVITGKISPLTTLNAMIRISVPVLANPSENVSVMNLQQLARGQMNSGDFSKLYPDFEERIAALNKRI